MRPLCFPITANEPRCILPSYRHIWGVGIEDFQKAHVPFHQKWPEWAEINNTRCQVPEKKMVKWN